MKIHLLACFLAISSFSYAQSLEQHVIGTAGYFSTTSNGSTLSATIGEVITTTENSSSSFITQGFQQPININPLSINNNLLNEIDIMAFPNPTLEQITVQKSQDETLHAELIDILGQTIAHYTLQDNSTSINLDYLPAANYLLRIRNESNQQIQILKIQKIQ